MPNIKKNKNRRDGGKSDRNYFGDKKEQEVRQKIYRLVHLFGIIQVSMSLKDASRNRVDRKRDVAFDKRGVAEKTDPKKEVCLFW